METTGFSESFGGRGAGTEILIEGLLLSGQKAIFADKAWAHRAYLASGIWSLNWVRDYGDVNATDFDAWAALNIGILNQNQFLINVSNLDLLEREQLEVIQQYYFDYTTAQSMKQPPLQVFVGAVPVAEGPNGLVNTGEWLSANANKNPMPGGPRFRDVVFAGRIDVFDHRWAWTNNVANGMVQIWTGTATAAGTPIFDAAKRLQESSKTMLDAAHPYSFDPSDLPPE